MNRVALGWLFNDWAHRNRILLIVASFLLILGYTLALVTITPNYGFVVRWTPDGILEVLHPLPDSPAEGMLQSGDRIVAIDNRPVVRSPWHFTFPPGRDRYEYTVLRGGQRLQMEIPVTGYPFYVVRRRLMAGLVSLAAWLVGSLVLLFATRDNRPALRVGWITLALAVSLALSEASIYGLPLAWFLAEPVMPTLAVAFAGLALVPGRQGVSGAIAWLLRSLYAVAVLLGGLLALDVLIFYPMGTSLHGYAGVYMYLASLVFIALCLLLNPVLLLWRWWTMPISSSREQIRLLFIMTLAAVTPLALLVILPGAILDTIFLEWEVALAFLILIPLTYGYVVFRHRFLGLDLLATHSVLMIFLGLFLLLCYCGAALALRLLAPEMWRNGNGGALAMGASLVAALASGRNLRRGAVALVYGRAASLAQHIGAFAQRLARQPTHESLAEALAEAVALLDVRQAFLVRTNENGSWLPLANVRMDGRTMSHLTLEQTPSQIAVRDEAEDLALWSLKGWEWVRILAPLQVEEERFGILLLGPKTPDEPFNGAEVGFVRELAATLAMALASVHLFESSRQVLRELLQVREEERAHLAARIHDDPLQRLSLVAGALDRLIEATEQKVLRAELQRAQAEVRQVSHQLRDLCEETYLSVIEQGVKLLVQEVVERFRHKNGLTVRLHIACPATAQTSGVVARSVYHILTEGLNNVVKHAGVTDVDVFLGCQDGYLRLEIHDQGCGFEIGHASLLNMFQARSFGLISMNEWARMAGGELSIDTQPGQGVHLCFVVPFVPSEANGAHFVERTPVQNQWAKRETSMADQMVN